MRARPRWVVHAVMLLVIVFWSGAFAWIKVALEELNPFDLTLARFLVAGVPFALVLAFTGVPRYARRDWPRLGVVALLSVLGYHTALNVGETGVSAGVAALIVATGPIWTALVSSLVLDDRISARKAAGIAIAVAGVVVLVLGRGETLTVHYLGAAFVALLAPMMWATSSVLSKPLLKGRDPLQFTALTSLLGTIPLLLYATGGTAGRLAEAGQATWIALLFLGLAATFLGNTGFFYGLRELSATETMAYVYLNPLFALGWAFFLTGESFTTILLAGGALVIVGVVLTNWPSATLRAPGTQAVTVDARQDGK